MAGEPGEETAREVSNRADRRQKDNNRAIKGGFFTAGVWKPGSLSLSRLHSFMTTCVLSNTETRRR